MTMPVAVHRHEEHRRPGPVAVELDLTGHDDADRGPVGTGDPLLRSVHHPAVAVGGRGGHERAGIGTGARRGLGHGEAGPDLAGGVWSQPALLLGVGACVREQVGVALVGGRHVERDVPERRVAGLLEDDGPADVAEAEPAVLGVDVGAEQAGVGGQRLELAAELVVRAVAPGADVALVGDDGVADEGARPVAQLDEVGGQGEIDHGSSLAQAAPRIGRPHDHSWRQNRPPGRPDRQERVSASILWCRTSRHLEQAANGLPTHLSRGRAHRGTRGCDGGPRRPARAHLVQHPGTRDAGSHRRRASPRPPSASRTPPRGPNTSSSSKPNRARTGTAPDVRACTTSASGSTTSPPRPTGCSPRAERSKPPGSPPRARATGPSPTSAPRPAS